MPAPRFRSRSLRRLQVKTPGARTKRVYTKRNHGLHKCAECGTELKGIPRMNKQQAVSAPKTAKRPERPYGGFLCSACARKKLKAQARAIKE